jgi:hypothetical protein
MAGDWHGTDWIGADYRDDDHARWLDRWTSPCPEGRPQRVGICLGHREREPGRLQLRVALCRGEGVCDLIVEEDEDTVRVRLLVCYDDERVEPGEDREYINCPAHVYLDKPLGRRTVMDMQTDEPVPVFVPDWG